MSDEDIEDRANQERQEARGGFVKRLIPPVAAVSLTMTPACGPKEDDDGGTSAAAENFCEEFEKCNAQDFEYYYDSVSDCADYRVESVNSYVEYVREYYGRQCGNALENYYNCRLSSSECTNSGFQYYVYNATGDCKQEYQAYYDACETYYTY